MNTELDVIKKEIDDPTTQAKKPKETFAYKWLTRAYRLAMIWSIIVMFAIVMQVIVVAYINKDFVIPGLPTLFGVAGVIVGALVGGEKAVDFIKSRNGGNKE